MHHGHSCTAEGRGCSRTDSGAAVSRSAGGVSSPHIGFLPVTRGADPCDGVSAAAGTVQGDQRRWHNAGAAAVTCVDDAGGSRSRMLLPGPLGRVAPAELRALIGSLPGGVLARSDGTCYPAHSAAMRPGDTAQPRRAMPHSHQFPSSLGCLVVAGAAVDQELPASPCGKRPRSEGDATAGCFAPRQRSQWQETPPLHEPLRCSHPAQSCTIANADQQRWEWTAGMGHKQLPQQVRHQPSLPPTAAHAPAQAAADSPCGSGGSSRMHYSPPAARGGVERTPSAQSDPLLQFSPEATAVQYRPRLRPQQQDLWGGSPSRDASPRAAAAAAETATASGRLQGHGLAGGVGASCRQHAAAAADTPAGRSGCGSAASHANTAPVEARADSNISGAVTSWRAAATTSGRPCWSQQGVHDPPSPHHSFHADVPHVAGGAAFHRRSQGHQHQGHNHQHHRQQRPHHELGLHPSSREQTRAGLPPAETIAAGTSTGFSGPPATAALPLPPAEPMGAAGAALPAVELLLQSKGTVKGKPFENQEQSPRPPPPQQQRDHHQPQQQQLRLLQEDRAVHCGSGKGLDMLAALATSKLEVEQHQPAEEREVARRPPAPVATDATAPRLPQSGYGRDEAEGPQLQPCSEDGSAAGPQVITQEDALRALMAALAASAEALRASPPTPPDLADVATGCASFRRPPPAAAAPQPQQPLQQQAAAVDLLPPKRRRSPSLSATTGGTSPSATATTCVTATASPEANELASLPAPPPAPRPASAASVEVLSSMDLLRRSREQRKAQLTAANNEAKLQHAACYGYIRAAAAEAMAASLGPPRTQAAGPAAHVVPAAGPAAHHALGTGRQQGWCASPQSSRDMSPSRQQPRSVLPPAPASPPQGQPQPALPWCHRAARAAPAVGVGRSSTVPPAPHHGAAGLSGLAAGVIAGRHALQRFLDSQQQQQQQQHTADAVLQAAVAASLLRRNGGSGATADMAAAAGVASPIATTAAKQQQQL